MSRLFEPRSRFRGKRCAEVTANWRLREPKVSQGINHFV